MSIQEIVLHPTDRPTVAFQGRVVARAIGPADDPLLSGWHHAISVYETQHGELHLEFKFMTECEQEVPRCDVELGIQAEDIEALMLLYDAAEYIDRDRIRHRYASVVTKFMKRLDQQYYDLCTSIERQMLCYEPLSHAVVAREGQTGNQPDHSGWRSWIRFGKPR